MEKSKSLLVLSLIYPPIPADWVDSFYQTAFENTVKIGDTLLLAIAIEHIPKLLPNNKVMVFYVAQGTTSYLDLASAIEEENTKFDLYAGLFFLVAGAIVFVVVKKVYNPKYNPANPKIQ